MEVIMERINYFVSLSVVVIYVVVIPTKFLHNYFTITSLLSHNHFHCCIITFDSYYYCNESAGRYQD
jgi:hypothetical protein